MQDFELTLCCSKMSLFDAAVEQVVKDVGKENVIAVKDRNMADYCKIWNLVIRKEHSWHWPWKPKYEYIPTEVTLIDILTEPLSDVGSLASTSVLFENYQSTPSFERSGKIGAKVANEFNIDASVSKTLQIVMKLGKITKKEILWEKLYEVIKEHQIKLEHPLIKMIKNKKKKKKLYLIGMIIFAGEEELDITEEIHEVVDGVNLQPSVSLNLDVNASGDQKVHTQYDIPAGTCLAYSCDEITINKNGVMSLELEEDLRK